MRDVLDPNPDYITVVSFRKKHWVRLMRWDAVADGYRVLREWKSTSRREAEQMAEDWAHQRGVELR